jgi:hypothetical protein
MESSGNIETSENQNSIYRYLSLVNFSMSVGGSNMTRMLTGNSNAAEAWIFRDDIGAPHGIKGYEEQVNSVGMNHGHNYWPSEVTWNTYNSATLRRGFKVF